MSKEIEDGKIIAIGPIENTSEWRNVLCRLFDFGFEWHEGGKDFHDNYFIDNFVSHVELETTVDIYIICQSNNKILYSTDIQDTLSRNFKVDKITPWLFFKDGLSAMETETTGCCETSTGYGEPLTTVRGDLSTTVIWSDEVTYIGESSGLISYNMPNMGKNSMNKISNTLKKVLPGDMQKQYKVGFRNLEMELTDEGESELLEILAEKYRKELTDRAKEIIKERSEENN